MLCASGDRGSALPDHSMSWGKSSESIIVGGCFRFVWDWDLVRWYRLDLCLCSLRVLLVCCKHRLLLWERHCGTAREREGERNGQCQHKWKGMQVELDAICPRFDYCIIIQWGPRIHGFFAELESFSFMKAVSWICCDPAVRSVRPRTNEILYAWEFTTTTNMASQ